MDRGNSRCKLPGKDLRGVERDLGGHAKRGIGIQPPGRIGLCWQWIQGRKNRHMKRNELLKYLRSQGCDILREGGKHSWWYNPEQNKRSAIPRHSEIKDIWREKYAKTLA